MAEDLDLDPILVIGGCGDLGSRIVQHIIDTRAASDITVFDLSTQHNRISGAKYIEGNLTSHDDVHSCLQTVRPRVVIHTASPRMMFHSAASQIFIDVNINGTQNLINCIQEVGCTQALVYTGSTSVVHNNHTSLINAVTEDMPLCKGADQPEFYTHTKAVAEELINAANTTTHHGLRTCTVRAALMFGERNEATMPTIIENARTGKLRYQVGDGTNMYDYTYVENTAYAHILAARALLRESRAASPPAPEMRVGGESFAITNDEPWPFWKFMRDFAGLVGYPIRDEDVRVIPTWVYYGMAVGADWGVWAGSLGSKRSTINPRMVRYLTMTRTLDISKAKTRLGYKPLVSMQEGLERTAKWFRENPPKKP